MSPGASRIKMVQNVLKKGLVKPPKGITPKKFIRIVITPWSIFHI